MSVVALSMRDKVFAIEKEILKQTQLDIPVKHISLPAFMREKLPSLRELW